MKLTALLMLVSCLHLHAAVNAQKVSLNARNASLADVFRQIRKQTDYLFLYDLQAIKKAARITLDLKDVPLEMALEACLKEQPFSYIIANKTIVLKPRNEITASADVAPPIRVTGIITDENGNPLQGVTVQVKGSSLVTQTNSSGLFGLDGVDDAAVLVFSYVGYGSREVPVNKRTLISLSLKPAENNLDETVIIAYGKTSRRLNTGTVSTVTSKDIANQPVTDPLAALQGRVPGLFIGASNGMPAARFSVSIRGQNSVLQANPPLFIIDGVPYASESLDAFSSANGSQSPLASMNPADIDRIDVLKDADATAIYGSRGANGVILITTKKGAAGKSVFKFNAYTGNSKVVNTLDMLNTQQYQEMRNEAFVNDNITKTEDNAPDLLLWDKNKSTDWQKFMIGHTAKLSEIQGSVSGGSAQTRFLLSTTYHKEETVMPGNLGYNRGSAHLNLDHTAVDGKFNILTSLSFSGDKNTSLATDITQFYNLAPNYPLYDDKGDYYWFKNIQNPQAYLERTSVSRTTALIANSVMRYSILPKLDLKLSLGYTQSNMDQTQQYPVKTFNPANNSESMAYYGTGDVHSYIAEPQITYDREISKGTLQLLAGATWQQNRREGAWYVGEGYSNDNLLGSITGATTVSAKTNDISLYKYTAFFGRVNYNWEDKYIVNASVRRDGSTRFGPGNRFGTFGAVGAAWIFTNESFFPTNRILSFGKLRASLGTAGNDNIGDYGYLDSWANASFPYDGISGLTPARLPNPYYKWEESRKREVALDLGFFNDRILFSANFYRNLSGNQLLELALSPTTGFPNYTGNFPATVLNRGWEFELNTVNVRTKDFTWKSSLNLSTNHNELKEFPDFESSVYKDIYVIGKSLSIVKGYQFTGVNPATGVPAFLDLDKDGSISEVTDHIILGKTAPEFYGGFQNSFSYKGFQLDFLFQFVKQEGPGVNYGYLSSSYGTLNNKDLSALERWQKDGDLTGVPKPSFTSGMPAYDAYTSNYRFSSAVWGDASYIRLKNISIRYDLSRFTQKWKLNNVAVYGLAQNMITITNYKGIDPETKGLFTPPLKTFTAGIQFSF